MISPKGLYEHQTVEMIYINKNGKITQRVVKIYGITEEKIFGYCFLRKGYRSFQKDQILALQPRNNRRSDKLA
ncbi:hypothetical protein [Salirhabdus sp. Marseille-P4669]|uniref:hypothetical protein n=1 Tax=Salirhabdus sp. Marseille-P4669 TaxID=2042310 RepID=UPI000C7AA5A2|nr:hypothetical protein [Salirhabdus sp. Marseille-P4669]